MGASERLHTAKKKKKTGEYCESANNVHAGAFTSFFYFSLYASLKVARARTGLDSYPRKGGGRNEHVKPCERPPNNTRERAPRTLDETPQDRGNCKYAERKKKTTKKAVKTVRTLRRTLFKEEKLPFHTSSTAGASKLRSSGAIFPPACRLCGTCAPDANHVNGRRRDGSK